MPKDYNLDAAPLNQQRRKELAQDDQWIKEFLARASIGHIATRWDEQPFITPTTFWYDAARHEIYFHSNVVDRIRANSEHHDRVCFEASDFGELLPSNVALEFSIQFESVIVFGSIRVLEAATEKREALSGLLQKYFPQMTSGKEYRPITDEELKRTAVYAISIESWSGKRNWPQQADRSDAWPLLIDRVEGNDQ
jgi:uncharacterized protein